MQRQHFARALGITRRHYSDVNSTQAQKLKINSSRLWNDIHHTAQWSAPGATTDAGGLCRLSGTTYDKRARDWFADQVRTLGASSYKVNATGSQIATFDGQKANVPPVAMGSHLDSVATGGRFDGPLGVLGALEVMRSFKEQGIKTHAPIALINWTNEEGARFMPPLGSSSVYAGQSSIEAAHASTANDGSGDTLGAALQAIGYVGDGPNTFQEFPIAGHFEIHVEQQTSLEEAGKPVGWVEGWQGITFFEVEFHGEDGHANTYSMKRRRDTLVGASKLIAALDDLAHAVEGRSTTTNIKSGPVGSCNIQSWTKVQFCVMHPELEALEAMTKTAKDTSQSIAEAHGLKTQFSTILHLEPGHFTPEAVDCVKRACGERGIGAQTLTAHDSTMTRLLCPTAMVFARAKAGISHCAQEWSSQEDCAESALVLGKAVLNFDQLLQDQKQS
ncbi:hypothetical protein LTR22_000532 [Elasticomyces elasticus]|nr:hypothetical protein LTR22_000532 [Elasticomyces elasticus]KAK4931997.1 hypothetical protein LTR49_001684 [Elasticomyces elasticus]KAK5768471.1 hypothetical protein LTS12_001259 [Elasticomyces elasticus]